MRLACRRVWRFAAKSSLNRAAAARQRRRSSTVADGGHAATTTSPRSRACCAWRRSSTHRHATSSASTCYLSTSLLHFQSSRADEMRAKRAFQHTFTCTEARHSLTIHSTHAKSSQQAHTQCAHITFTTHSHCRDAVWRDLPAHVQRYMYTALLHDALAARACASVTADNRACELGRVGSQNSKIQRVNLLKSGIRPVPRQMSSHSEAWRISISSFGIIHTSRYMV